MRILYLADVRFPIERANGIQTFETCYGLAERGHSVTLVVRPDTASPARDPFAFYGRQPHSGLEFCAAPLIPGAPLVRRASYLAFALRVAAGQRRDTILTRDLGVASALLRVPRGMRPPVVYESHGYSPEVRRTLPALLGTADPASAARLGRLEGRERRVWRRAAGYVTLTRALRDELTTRFGPRERVAVIPDGVRLDGGPPPARVRPAVPVVTYAGHLYPWKGVDVYVEALARLPGVHGRVVGGHPGEADLSRIAAAVDARGIAHRVTLTGLVEPAAVRRLLHDSDVLVLPNPRTRISERYTSPLKLFEYMASGRPMVVSRLPALEEIVTHGESAWLVEPGDPSALAAGIRHVLDEPDLASRLARGAWTAVQEYGWDRRAARLETLLAAAAAPAA